MDKLNCVYKQYQNQNNLKTRSNIHKMYSTNKQGFMNWIFERYKLENNANVLELGCGDGDIWKHHINNYDLKYELTLSDISPGMLKNCQENLFKINNVKYRVIDIQDIPYEDNTFDIIIANMMLYHVPNLNLGLKEVSRVLKPNGTFYCATFGKKTIGSYINNLSSMQILNESTYKFTLQNGSIILSNFFDSIEKDVYLDALHITKPSDLIDYLNSFSEFSNLSHDELSKVTKILNDEFNRNNGLINIPKEYGMFIAKGKYGG